MTNIIFDHVSKIYDDNIVINNLSLKIKENDFVVLVGPSGCGKSTILKMIAGIEETSSGNIYINEQKVRKYNTGNQNIEIVFQSYGLNEEITVERNIGFSLKKKKVKRSFIKEKILEVAKLLDIEDLLQKYPNELSGGQKQRVALAKALISETDIYLFDEPLSNLDPKMRMIIRNRIRKLYQQTHKTFIYVTHDQIEAMTMGNKIVVINDGAIQQIGTPLEVYNHPENAFVATFFGTPQMNMLNGKIMILNQEYYLCIEGQMIKIPCEQKELFDNNLIDKDLLIGIRPSSIKTIIENKDCVFKTKYVLKENYGSECLLLLKIDNRKEELRVLERDDNEYIDNQEIYLEFDFNEMHFFDKESLKRVK